jgi:hypothetical protein
VKPANPKPKPEPEPEPEPEQAPLSFCDDIVFSDDDEDLENEEKVAQASEHVLRFGMHKGTTIGEMIQTREKREYLRFLQRWDKLSFTLGEAIKTMFHLYDVQVEERKKVIAV